MHTSNRVLSIAAFGLAMACISCGGGMGDPSSSGGSGGEGEDQFEVSLVRVTDLEATSRSVFSDIGNDPLAQGRVEVEELGENEVDIVVQGAAANTAYNAFFCPFAAGTGGCFAVTSFTTDNQGNAEVKVAFPQTGTFAGVFLLRSGGLNQLVTGLAVPAPEFNFIRRKRE